MRKQKHIHAGITTGVISAGTLYISTKCDIILDEEQQSWPPPWLSLLSEAEDPHGSLFQSLPTRTSCREASAKATNTPRDI